MPGFLMSLFTTFPSSKKVAKSHAHPHAPLPADAVLIIKYTIQKSCQGFLESILGGEDSFEEFREGLSQPGRPGHKEGPG